MFRSRPATDGGWCCYSLLGFLFREILTQCSLTGCRAKMIQGAFGNLIPFHPSINFLWIHFIVSDRKDKLLFVSLDKFPFKPFPNNGLHLLRFDILVQVPLTYACSVLSYPVYVVRKDPN
jgi:hypothetical protein